MQRDDSPTLGACPLCVFFEQMLFHANSFGANAVLDQTNLIPLPVALIEPLDDGAGELWTLETKIDLLSRDTIFDLALPTMIGLASSLSATTEAGLLLAEMYVADGAGDSAWSQHVLCDGRHLHGSDFPWCYIFTTGCLNTVFILSGAALRGSLR